MEKCLVIPLGFKSAILELDIKNQISHQHVTKQKRHLKNLCDEIYIQN